jgi:hypothetical protein
MGLGGGGHGRKVNLGSSLEGPSQGVLRSLTLALAMVVYGRFCKSAGGAGSWYAGDVQRHLKDAHHAPRQA